MRRTTIEIYVTQQEIEIYYVETEIAGCIGKMNILFQF